MTPEIKLIVSVVSGPTVTIGVPGVLYSPAMSGGTYGDAPAGQAYTFIQDTPSAQWIVQHNLGRYPAAIVIDSAGSVCEGELTYPNDRVLILDFSFPFAGVCYLV